MESNPIEHKSYLVMRHLMYRILSEPMYAQKIDKYPDSLFDGGVPFQHMYAIAKQEYRHRGYDKPIQREWLRTELAGKLDRLGASVEERGTFDYVLSDTYTVDNTLESGNSLNRTVSDYIKKIRVTNAIKKVVANELQENAIEDFIKGVEAINSDTASRELPIPINVLSPESKDTIAESMKALLVARTPMALKAYNIATSGGLSKGEMGCIAGSSGSGKAEPHSTLIPTPDGIRRFGDLEVGDYVYNRFGNPIRVGAIYEQGEKQAYKVTTGDGRSSVFNNEHLFSYISKNNSTGEETLKTKSLQEMMDMGLKRPNNANKYYIPTTVALEFPERDLPLDPYTVGALIGDGYTNGVNMSLSASIDKKSVVDRIANNNGWKSVKYSSKNYTHYFKGVDNNIIKSIILPKGIVGTASTKCVPVDYLQGSINQRLELAKGLLDTDGSVRIRKNSGTAMVTYHTASDQLALDVVELLRSLGYEATLSTQDRTHQEGRNYVEHVINISAPVSKLTELFHSPVKLGLLKNAKEKRRRYDRTTIESIEDLGYTTKMRCIYVEDDEHLYVTNDYIVTHNTMHLSSIASGYASQGKDVAYIALEELAPRMIHRFYKNVVSMYFQTARDIVLDAEQKKNLATLRNSAEVFENGTFYHILESLRQSGISFGNIYLIKYLPYEMGLAELTQSLEDLTVAQGKNIDVVCIDYPDLMDYDRSAGESEAGGRLYASIRGVGQKYDVIMWVASQLNRTTYGADLKTEAHMEGSYRKQNALEFLGVVNQYPEEYENGFTRIYVAKSRNSTSTKGTLVQVSVDSPFGVLRDQTPFEANKHSLIVSNAQDSGGSPSKGSTKSSSPSVDDTKNMMTSFRNTAQQSIQNSIPSAPKN